MKGLGTATILTLFLFIASSLFLQSSSVPQAQFWRRNWTPQAMLYLKGAPGRWFIAEDEKENYLIENIDIETRSRTDRPLTLAEATVLFLAKIREAELSENPPHTEATQFNQMAFFNKPSGNFSGLQTVKYGIATPLKTSQNTVKDDGLALKPIARFNVVNKSLSKERIEQLR
ncbi:spexin prohormone 1 [Mobula hypostoma]|uniref:spexin prohormone 1 n=1 Tax=Mobula hypostoma TaxID=723540 RepID=UPI002FC31F83